jgi:hypothetical protein
MTAADCWVQPPFRPDVCGGAGNHEVAANVEFFSKIFL